MRRLALLGAALASLAGPALGQQTVAPAGTAAKNAQAVQGVVGGVPVPISGTISATSTVHSTTAAPTYSDGTDNAFSSDLGGALRVLCMGGTCGGASPFADGAAFTGGSTSVGVVAGVFDDTLGALTAGHAAAPRMTSKRALHFNLRDASGNEIPFPAALAASGGLKVDIQNTSLAVTGTFWQSTQPVSLAALPALVAGGALIGKVGIDQTTPGTTDHVSAILLAGSAVVGHVINDASTAVIGHVINDASSAVIGHVISDTGSTTAVTGNVTVIQGTGTNLHTVIDSGTVTANISGSISNTAFAQTTTAVSSASSTGSCVSVTANTTVLAANASRHAAYILPKSTNTDYVMIKLGATATTAQPPLAPGQPFNLDPAGSIYTGQIDAIAASGSQVVCVMEW